MESSEVSLRNSSFMTRTFSGKFEILCFGVLILILALNTPLASQLGSPTSLVLNGVVLATFVTVGAYVSRVADKTKETFVIAGLKRSRRLFFLAYGGYFLCGTIGVFGATVLMVANPRVPRPLEMPDASLFAIYCMGLLLWLLIDGEPSYRSIGRFGPVIVLLLLVTIGALEVGGILSSHDVFGPVSSLCAISIWLLISRETRRLSYS